MKRRTAAAWLTAALAGCGKAAEPDAGSDSMFGLFKGKRDAGGTGSAGRPKSGDASAVHPALAATLVRDSGYPAGLSAPSFSYGRSAELALVGAPPAGRLASANETARTARAFRIDGLAGVPPLALVNVDPDAPRIESWELGNGSTLEFVRRRDVQLDPAQSTWAGYSVQQVLCLPGRQQAVAVHYVPREARYGLYLHDAGSGRFTRLAEHIDPDTWHDGPRSFVDVLPVRADAAILLYRSDPLRLAAEIYVSTREHLLLFAPAHPAGLEVLTLAVADGNVRRMGVRGSTLHIEGVDPRKRGEPVTHHWSLDLARVL
jgi:hypothetical protein